MIADHKICGWIAGPSKVLMLGRRLHAPLRLLSGVSRCHLKNSQKELVVDHSGDTSLWFLLVFFFSFLLMCSRRSWCGFFFFIAAQFCQDILFALIRLFQFCFFSYLGRERVKSGLWDLENPPGLKRVCRSSWKLDLLHHLITCFTHLSPYMQLYLL